MTAPTESHRFDNDSAGTTQSALYTMCATGAWTSTAWRSSIASAALQTHRS